MSRVRLAPFDSRRDLAMLARWLDRPHVTRWWGDPARALAASRQHSVAKAALIEVDARPVGYVCWQNPSPEELVAVGLSDLPTDLVDVDILIGEPDAQRQGVGAEALSQLVARLRAEGARVVGLAAAVVNLSALKAYTRAGFRSVRDFRESGQDMRYLLQIINAAD